MFRKIAFIMLIMLLAAGALPMRAQQDREVRFDQIDTILNKVILKREIMGGAMAHTSGWGLIFRKAYNQNAFVKNVWEVEFFGIRADKQVRINYYGAYYSDANSYVYGKLNKVYDLRSGFGQQHLLNSKPYWGGVEVRLAYYGGISIGISKPIYLYIFNEDIYESPESRRYDPDKHFVDNIYGRAPFIDGLQKTTFHPGGYLKGGLSFDFGAYNTSIKALEVGAMIDAYITPIALMAFEDKHYFFFNFYLNFTFGKRYNRL